MGCPHGGDGRRARDQGIERRQFLLSAVAIGGASAFAACLDREDSEPASGGEQGAVGCTDDTDDSSAPEFGDGSSDQELINGGTDDPDYGAVVYKNQDRENSQHAWNNYLAADENGVPRPPKHHVLVMADYAGTGVPTDSDRTEMEAALETLEMAYEWSNEGLLFTVGYSPSYFSCFGTSLPPEVDLPNPAPLSAFEEPVLDNYDVCLHLASDYAQAVLGAEEALFGNVDELNGVRVEHTVEGVLEKRDRRTGFIGEGLPAANQDVQGIPDSDPVPDDAPLFMGFHSQNGTTREHPARENTEDTFVHNQNSEYGVTIPDGRFEGGTTQQVSRIHLDLHEWYGDMSLEDRIKRIFSSQDTTESVGALGENALEGKGGFPGVDVFADGIEEQGHVGHATKLARSRESGISPLLRRDFDTTDEGHAGVHFVSLQEGISDFVRTRMLMNGTDVSANFEDIDERTNNGILNFIEVKNRANFLVPPPDLRSLPHPQ